MANNKNSLAICDTCGFRYPHRVMRMNSYGMLVCLRIGMEHLT